MNDPLLCDHERLRTLASDAVVRQGLAAFKEQRVVEISFGEGRIDAQVQDADAPTIFFVQVEVEVGVDGDADAEATDAEDGDDAGHTLIVDCTCPGTGEPGCAHVVAALLAYAARQPVSAAAERTAADAAIAERVRRGRAEVTVRPLSVSGWPATFAARSVTSQSGLPTEYRVELRSVTERLNLCTCPDFAHNRLGTCKHIEAVLHHVEGRKRGRGRGAVALEPDRALVYVDWTRAGGPRISLRRGGAPTPALDTLLRAHFDAEGRLRGALPDAWDRFAAHAEGQPDVHLGADAAQLARRAGQDAAHTVRAEAIRREIERSGGRLAGVNARLYPYQVQGVAFLAARGRAILADDMGLGKTLQAIAAAAWLMEHDGLQRVLVVCPASLKGQWAREISRFTRHPALVVEGNTRARLAAYRRRAPFTIVNYEVVMRDLTAINAEFAADLVILDEAQRIKNWRTQTAARIKSLMADRAFVLTGTPLENRLEDLYSLMQVIDQRVLGPLWQFMLHFHVVDERGKVLGYRNLTELRQRLAPVMLRRDRRLVSDQLPERIEHRLDVPMTPKQQDMQDGALQTASTYAQIMKRRPLTPVEEKRLLSALQTARMACNAAGLVDGETQGAPKLDELARLLEELCLDGGRKVVVFSQWTRMTEMAEAVARKLGLGTARLHGGVPSPARGKLIERFQTDAGTQVFLSTDAGGVGLNLQCASALVNLDLPWNPAVLDQRLARIHRLGQREPVQLILLVSSPSYEERVGAIIGAKRHLFTHVVGEDASEDVIGLSKRTMELALEALAPAKPKDDDPSEGRTASKGGEHEIRETEPEPEPESKSESDGATAGTPTQPTAPAQPEGWSPEVARAVAALQTLLGERLERVLLRGEAILALVDRVDEHIERLAAEAGGNVTVTVLATATWLGLRAFAGAAFADATEAYTRPVAAHTDPPLVALARRKLDAAGALRERGCALDALECLTAALLAAFAHRAGESAAPAAADAAAWLFGTALPGGHIAAADAHVALRVQGLSLARSVPDALLASAFADAEAVLAGVLDAAGG
jgi:superfamily II DNA or RNA helicase